MKLWSHHPSTFKLDDPALGIDSTKGEYWNSPDPNFRARYRQVLPKLQKLIGTDQFVWCCSKRGLFERTNEEIDLVEWELDITENEKLGVYRIQVWNDIVCSRSEDWGSLFCDDLFGKEDDDVGVLVRVPLLRHQVQCLGPLLLSYPRQKQIRKARRLPLV